MCGGLFALLVLSACKHPLAIVGEGDIVDLNGSDFGCSLEQFQNDSPKCLGNEVINADYRVNYSPQPRPGWQFVRWDGPCGHLSEGNNCAFDVSAPFVAWFDELGAGADGTAYTITAVFERQSYRVGGNVQGLSGKLILSLNAGPNLVLGDSGSFEFPTTVAHESGYEIVVQSQPAGQSCTVDNASGTVSAADVTDIQVTCETDAFSVTGAISGHTGDIELTLNGANNLVLGPAQNEFSFGSFDSGSRVEVAVFNAPDGQSCAVAGGSSLSLQTDMLVNVTCTVLSFVNASITVNGLAEDDEISVLVNGILTATGNGSFGLSLVEGSVLDVSIDQVVPRYECAMGGDEAGIVGEPLAITLDCSNRRFYVGGLVSGHNDEVTIGLSGQESLTVLPGTDAFSFGEFDYGTPVTLEILESPTLQDCSIEDGASSGIQANLTARISCAGIPLFDLNMTIAGLESADEIELIVEGSPIVSGNGTTSVSVLRDTVPTVSLGTVPSRYSCAISGDISSPVVADRDITVSCIVKNIAVTVLATGLAEGDALDFVLNGVNQVVSASGVVIELPYETDLTVAGTIPPEYSCPAFDTGLQSITKSQDYVITCSQVFYSVSGKILGLPDAGGLSVIASVNGISTQVTTAATGTYVLSGVAPPGADIEIALEFEPPEGFVCDDPVHVTGIQGDAIRQDIECEPSGTVTVLIDRVDPVGEFTLDLQVNGVSQVLTVVAEATEVVFADLPQSASYDLNIDNGPADPGFCTIANDDGVVGEATVLNVECEYVISRMGMSAELEACVSGDGSRTYLREVPATLDCRSREIDTLDGINYLSAAVTNLDLSSNLLQNGFSGALHSLTNLEQLDLGDNSGFDRNDEIVALENALPDTLVRLSDPAGGEVEVMRVEIVFTEAALAQQDVLGSIGFTTFYWDSIDTGSRSVNRQLSESLSRRFETTTANSLTHSLDYIVDLTNLDDAISCEPSAVLLEDEVLVSISCDRDQTAPDIAGSHSGLLPADGLAVTVLGDPARLRIDESYDVDYLIVDRFVLDQAGQNYGTRNVPSGHFEVRPETDEFTYCTVSNMDGVLDSDRQGVNIDCTQTIAALVSPVSNPGLYDCLSLMTDSTRRFLASEVPAMLDCSEQGISELTGLENFFQIQELVLDANDLADDAFDEASDPVYGLPNLEFLSISGNYNIRLSATLNTLQSLLPDVDINTANLNAAGLDRSLTVDILFSEEAGRYFDVFGTAIVGGVRLHGLETDSFDNQSETLTNRGDSANFFPVRDGSDAFLDYMSVRPSLTCADEPFISMTQDVLLESECSVTRLDEYSVFLFGGGYDRRGRESGVISGLEIVFQRDFPYSDVFITQPLGDLSFDQAITGFFPGDESDVNIQPSVTMGEFAAPEGVYCDGTAGTTMTPGHIFVLPCSQSTVFGSSTITSSESMFASNQVLYALRVLSGEDVQLVAQSSTDARMRLVTGESQTVFTTGVNTTRTTLYDVTLSAGIPDIKTLDLAAGNYVVAVQNRDADFVGEFEIAVHDELGVDSREFTLRPISASDVTLGSWFGSEGAFTEDVLLNPTHTLTIASSDGGSGLSSGAVVRIDLQSSTIDTYLVLTGDNNEIVALNDDSGDGTSNSTILVQLPPGTYQVVAATFADGLTGSYLLSVSSSLPAHTSLYQE